MKTVHIHVLFSTELSTYVTVDQESASRGTQTSRTTLRKHQETARRRRSARQVNELSGLWIAKYVVSAYIIVTTLVLTTLGINLVPAVMRADDGVLALDNELVGVCDARGLMTLSCFLGSLEDYRKARANKVRGFLTVRTAPDHCR